ncbi:hypothetical protein [Yinghuangia seranimata]|uniref:hypothetical protein n=1 Tax=Yinghuangia seranimata TaxID=408067 RepID=UPI00248C566C|nr:hypothetical protein [Yinghuangia seranimata]MDI2129196.1 hypothetical protein [Yinghuangia seranimata]
MVVSLIAAVAAAVFYGVATVLQALGTRRTERSASEGLDPRLLVRVFKTWPFVAGTLLDLAGFAAQLVALAELPVFAVEAAQAANLAVTAVVAVPLLGVTLGRREWGAVGAVCVGLALLGLSAGAEGPSATGDAFRYALLGSVAVIALLGMWAARRPEPWRSRLLGLTAGLGFGLIALAGRVVTDVAIRDLWTDPAAWTVLLAGAVTLLMYATALQGGAVTAVAAALVVGETVLPAAVGIIFLGDHSRPGFVPVAAVGFVLAVAGAMALARFGEGGDPPAGGNSEADPADAANASAG